MYQISLVISPTALKERGATEYICSKFKLKAVYYDELKAELYLFSDNGESLVKAYVYLRPSSLSEIVSGYINDAETVQFSKRLLKVKKEYEQLNFLVGLLNND